MNTCHLCVWFSVLCEHRFFLPIYVKNQADLEFRNKADESVVLLVKEKHQDMKLILRLYDVRNRKAHHDKFESLCHLLISRGV